MKTKSILNRINRYAVATLLMASIVLSPISSSVVHAARTVTSATLNGSTSVTVNAGATITALVNVTTNNNNDLGNGGNQWRCTAWLISTDGTGSYTNYNNPDHTGAGSYSETFSIIAPASSGTYNTYFKAYQQDTGGVCTGDVSGVYVMANSVIVNPPADVTPPVITITTPAAGASVNSSAIITFTNTETTNPQCSVDNTVWGSCVSGVSTLGSVTGFSALSQGAFTLYVKDTDPSNNTGSTSRSLVKDTISPTAIIGYSTTAPTSGDVVATSTASEVVTYTNNSGNNQYTFTGNGSFTFQFADAAGNTGTATAIVTNIDKNGPGITITSPAAGSSRNGTTIVGFTVDEPATITCSVDGSNYVACTPGVTTLGDFAAFTGLADGTQNFHVRAIDAALNATTIAVSYTKDTTAPTATVGYDVTTPTNGDVIATATPSETVTFTSAGGNTHTFSSNGTFTFEFTDAAGNTGTAVAQVSNIDKTPPSLSETTAVTTPTSVTTPQYVFNSSEAGDITYGGGCSSATTTAVSGTNTISFSTSGDGVYSCTITVTDAAGNVSATLNVTDFEIDTTAPTATVGYDVTTPTNGDVIATATPSETVTFTSAGGNTHTFSSNGTFTFEFTDAAGNTGTAVAQVTNIDTAGPTVNAGADITTGTLFSRTASANDSNGIQSVSWQKSSGPGTITFGSPTNLATTIIASAEGTYVIRFSATDNAGNTNSDTFVLNWENPIVTAQSTTTPTPTITPVAVTTAATPVSESLGAETTSTQTSTQTTQVKSATDDSDKDKNATIATVTSVESDDGGVWSWLRWLLPLLILGGFVWFILWRRRRDEEEQEKSI